MVASDLAALNNFFDSGDTWADAFGNTVRIDYLLVFVAPASFASSCVVDKSLDLSTGVRDDHFALVARLARLVCLCSENA